MTLQIAFNKSWVSEVTWCCIVTLARSFFTQETLDIYSDTDVQPLVSSGLWAVYTSNASLNTSTWRSASVDSIYVAKNLHNFNQLGRRGRSLIVTLNMSSSLSFWSVYKMADTVIIHDDKAYTWYPFHRGQCSQTPRLEKIDDCSQCRWSKNLYPTKIPKNFKGCVVSHIVGEWPAYVIKNPDGTIRGLETNMMKLIGESYGLHSNITCVSFHDFDSQAERPVGATLALLRGEADFMYGISYLRIKQMEFLDNLPISYKAPAMFIFPAAKPKPRFSSIYSGFSKMTLSLIVLSLFSAGFTVFFGCWVHKTPWHWLYVISCFTIVSIPNMPDQRTLRIFFLVFYLYSQHIAWFYQTTLLQNLFTEPMETQIKSMREAIDAGLSIMGRSFMVDGIRDQDPKIFEELKKGRIIDGVDLNFVLQRKAFILGIVLDVDKIWKSYSKEVLQGVYLHTKPYRSSIHVPYGKKDAIFTKLFVKRLHLLKESGIINHFKHIDPELSYLRRNKVSHDDRKTLDLEMLEGAFFLYFLIIIFSVLALACEMICYRYSVKNKTVRRAKP